MKAKIGSILIVLILSGCIHTTLAANSTPSNLFLTVYSDGVVDIEYKVNLDPTLARVNVQVFGLILNEILIVNQKGDPLTYTQSGSTLIVDSLGSNSITITYNTQDLTQKTGSLWTLNITAPININVILPLGSTILSISEIPLEIGSVDGKTFLSLIAGNIAVSYILGTVGTKDHAQAMLKDAESTISEIMSKGIKVESALNLLNQAKSAFNTSDYAKAEQLSSSAKLTATNIESQANTAIQSINRASTAISTAKNEGRTSGLSNAENLLKEAQAAYASGSYSSASLTAGRAYDAALASKNEGIDPLQVLIVVGVVALLVIGFILLKRKPKPTPQKPIEFVPEPPVNLELIFSGNPELRMDDREVIRFLADNKGEAFANEIRDRFGIPRTSAWRMIHRLIKMGIVEEKKIGGQSLIRVIKKWRRST